jgi:DNA polymerase-1
MTAGGKPSVSAAVLKSMEYLDPLISKILEWRKMGKVRSTYAEGLLPFITSSGRVHPDLLLDGTASGRLSCREPNLQNIPRADTELGTAVRLAFRPKAGRVFIQADYSQLELRVAAMLSGDPEMMAIFNEGVDYHQRTAELVSMKMWGIAPDKVKKQHRQAAKTFNFGLLYGMSDAGIAKQIGVSADEARNLRAAVLGKFSILADWIREQLSLAKSTGYASTYYDGQKARRRWLPDLYSLDKRAKSSAERSSWNTPVQGTASDICLRSLVEVVNWIKEDAFPGMVVSTVHDSIMLEVEEDSLDEAAYQLQEIMTQWDSNGVPLVVDLESGPSWAELSTYKPNVALDVIITDDTENL